MTRRLARGGLAVLAIALVVAVVPQIRSRALQTMGALLVVNDPVEPVDLIAMTESGDTDEAGVLEVSEMYRNGVAPRVLLLVPAPRPDVSRPSWRPP